MFTQTNYSDAYDREKLRILQALNTQVQTMVVKLDQIVTQAEENIFKIKTNSQSSSNTLSTNRSTLVNLNGSFEKQPTVTTTNTPSKSAKSFNKKAKSIASLSKSDSEKNLPQSETTPIKQEPSNNQTNENKPKQSAQVHNKRNKQQRIFNTFVRDSINQLLGPEFMKTHDVQDIDAQVMEMIRKEAVENYLPDNIRPRRAWHLAKASLRTLKRTLNNRKT